MKTIATDLNTTTQTVIIRARLRAFSCEGVRSNLIRVAADGEIRAWDDVAGMYTTLHSIGPVMQGKLRAEADRIRKA